MDYSIQLSKLFYERFIEDKEITLFSPHDVPELYNSGVIYDPTRPAIAKS